MVRDEYQPRYKIFREEEEYEERENPTFSILKTPRSEYRRREETREIKVERRSMHRIMQRMLTEDLQPIKKISPKVIGNLFDRVNFLKQRIAETKAAIEMRQRLHEELIKEIEEDIRDKQSLLSGLSNIDDIRDFKLDISTLRMEKRRETVQFWRDIWELTRELRELMEEYEMESKIANLFKELKGE